MGTTLKLMVARAAVQSKEEAGYRRKPGGTMDVETTFDLSTVVGRESLALVLRTKGYTVWQFKDGVRSRKNTRAMTCVALDYDHGKSINDLSAEFSEYIHVIAPTARHTIDQPRFRVLLPLSTPADDPLKFAETRKWLINRFPDSDPRGSFTISQPVFPCAKYYLVDDTRTKSWAHENFDDYFRINVDGIYFELPDVVGESGDEESWPALDPHLSKYRKELYQRSLDILVEDGVKDGGRDNRAIVIASESRKCGNDIAKTGRIVFDWNDKNDPPLPLEDIERIVKSAYTGDGYDFGEGDDALKAAREQVRADIKRHGLSTTDNDDDDDDDNDIKPPPSLSALMTNPKLTERPKTVGKWISWRQRITLLVGAAKKSGKSTLCTYESLAVLADNGCVLWVSNDEPLSDVVRRFKEAGIDDDAASRTFVLHNEIPGVMPRSWKGLYEIIVAVNPDIIILDSIHTIFPLFSKSGEVPESHETALWQAETSRLRSAALVADAAVVWIHHTNKAGNSIGSIGIEAAVDVIASFRRGGGRSPNTRELSFLGRFVGPANNKVLQYINETDGYRELDLTDNSENDRNKEIEEWILSQFDGVEEIKTSIMNKRIEEKFKKSSLKQIRMIAQDHFNITIGKTGRAFRDVSVWCLPPSVDPSQYTNEGDK